MQGKGSTLVLKPRTDVTGSPKRGYWSPPLKKKGLDVFQKNWNFFFKNVSAAVTQTGSQSYLSRLFRIKIVNCSPIFLNNDNYCRGEFSFKLTSWLNLIQVGHG